MMKARIHTLIVAALVLMLFTGCQMSQPFMGIARWTDHPPILDGQLDDPAWKHAVVIDHFPSYWAHTNPGPFTKAWLLWDQDALYFAAKMTDKELRSFGEKHNDMIWNGDVFELFFKPSDASPRYYEFQVNPKGVLLELAIPHAVPFDFFKLAAEPPLGMQAAVKLAGTLNHPGDVDRGWVVEGKIPWSAFAATGGRPEPGAVWRFALCRYDYGTDGTEPVLTSSAPLGELSFHLTTDYGWLIFEPPPKR